VRFHFSNVRRRAAPESYCCPDLPAHCRLHPSSLGRSGTLSVVKPGTLQAVGSHTYNRHPVVGGRQASRRGSNYNFYCRTDNRLFAYFRLVSYCGFLDLCDYNGKQDRANGLTAVRQIPGLCGSESPVCDGSPKMPIAPSSESPWWVCEVGLDAAPRSRVKFGSREVLRPRSISFFQAIITSCKRALMLF
jgi:hypothetical protein